MLMFQIQGLFIENAFHVIEWTKQVVIAKPISQTKHNSDIIFFHLTKISSQYSCL